MKTARFPGRFDSLSKISKFVVSAAKEAGLGSKAIYAVELAVDEAASNIIEHAYGGEGKGSIECECQAGRHGLLIILRDNGKPFDPQAIPDLNTNVPLMERQPGGAGIFLIRKLMDEVIFSFSPNGGNELRMFKSR